MTKSTVLFPNNVRILILSWMKWTVPCQKFEVLNIFYKHSRNVKIAFKIENLNNMWLELVEFALSPAHTMPQVSACSSALAQPEDDLVYQDGDQ